MRLLISLVVGLAVTTLAATASAYGSGATGYTGKQEDRTCNSCHSGGTAPQVAITGPDTLAAGATADFTMVVTTKQTKAGGGIAATEGATLTAGTGLQDLDGELTHSAALGVSGGKATFKFKVTAPATGTSMTIFAVGLAANGSGTSGDKATQTTKAITITGGDTAPTTPSTPADPDEQANQATTGSTAGSTSTGSDATQPAKTTKTKKSSSDDDDDDDDGSRDRRDLSSDAATSCAMQPGKLDPAGLGAAGAVLFGLALLGRRRRP